MKEEMEEDKSDWKRFEEMPIEPMVTSEFEHKMELLKTPIKKKILEPEDILTTALQLSRIDSDSAYIYVQKASAAQEWRQLGFEELAKARLADLMLRFSISKSIGGFERAMQTAGATAHVEFSEKEGVRFSPQEDEDEGGGGGGLKGLMASLKNRQREKLR